MTHRAWLDGSALSLRLVQKASERLHRLSELRPNFPVALLSGRLGCFLASFSCGDALLRRRADGGARLRLYFRLLRSEEIGKRLIERRLHHNPVRCNRDDALELREICAFGLQVHRHHVQEGVFDRDDDQLTANDLEPFWSHSVNCCEMVVF